jgi:voltage-gated potassium channel
MKESGVRLWDALATLVVVFVAAESPLRLAEGWPLSGRHALIDLGVALVLAIEIARAFARRRIELAGETAGQRLFQYRAWRRFVTLDALAIVPSFLLVLPADLATRLAPLALLRLAAIHRLHRAAERVGLARDIHPGVMRLGRFVFWLGLLAHWIACGWLALRAPAEYVKQAPRYLEALYWTMTTLTTIGYGDVTPSRTPELLYTMLVMVIGVGGFSYVIGSVAGLLANLDRAKLHFQERVERAHAFMAYRGVPADLRHRILGYYSYLWESRLGWGDAELLDDLPSGLRVEVSLHLHRPILEKVPFLRGASDELLRDLSVALRPTVCAPGEVLFRRGQTGKTMYFVSHGEVDILGADGQLLQRMTTGDFFGEVALLGGQVRNATARAASYSDLYTLDQEDFDRVLTQHPEFEAEVRRRAAERSGGPH